MSEAHAELLALAEGLRGMLLWQAETGVRYGSGPVAVELPPDPWAEAAPPARERGPARSGQPPTPRTASRPEADRTKPRAPAAAQPRPPELEVPELDLARAAEDPGGTLDELAQRFVGCTRCGLAEGRAKVVFGAGAGRPRLLLVGEGPGAQEDLQGLPFVGPAGELLDAILQRGMGLRRDEVYITNVVKCRPPRNRDPNPDEVVACLPLLRAQITILRPPAILALGRVAAQCLLDSDKPLGALRGSWHGFGGIPLRATYHPAYLLRHPERKRWAWEDVQAMMAKLGLHRPGG